MFNVNNFLNKWFSYIFSCFSSNNTHEILDEFKAQLKTDIQLKAYELKAANLSLKFKFDSQIKALELDVPPKIALKYKDRYQAEALWLVKDSYAALKINTETKLKALQLMLDKELIKYHPNQCMNIEPVMHFKTKLQLDLLIKDKDLSLITNLNPYSHFIIKKFGIYEPWAMKFDNPNQIIAALFCQDVERSLAIDTSQKLFDLYHECELSNKCNHLMHLQFHHIPQSDNLELYQQNYDLIST